MDRILYNAAITGNIDVLRQNDEKVARQVTPDKNTVLHLASQLGKTEAVEMILSMHPSLLIQANSYGDTALHLAARGGHASVTRVLIDFARRLDEDIESRPHAWQFILWTENVEEETPLHVAVRYNQPRVVTKLIEEDRSYWHSANKKGETPLYIAANRGFDEVVDAILKNCEAPNYSGPNGKTALHGAVLRGSKECTRKLLEWKRTMVTVTDANGQTALHYASNFESKTIADLLLCADPSIAYIADRVGTHTALHTAVIGGNLPVVKEILLQCPDSWGMVNKKGQNILHLAITANEEEVVEFILEKCPVISSLINQKDCEGNTPCHVLAVSRFCMPKLIEHDMVDKAALNNSDLTPFGYAAGKGENLKALIKMSKKSEFVKSTSGLITWKERYKHKQNEATPATPTTHRPDDRAKEVRKYVSTHIIVAALIVTVTFAAGFTMPGGYIHSGEDDNEGMAVLTKSVAFQAFVISDSLALLFSSAAVFLHMLTASHANEVTVADFFRAGAGLTMLALVAMMIAFLAGTYAVLAHSSALAIAACLLGCTIFPIYFTIFYRGVTYEEKIYSYVAT